MGAAILPYKRLRNFIVLRSLLYAKAGLAIKRLLRSEERTWEVAAGDHAAVGEELGA
jgi:hypothetical protein